METFLFLDTETTGFKKSGQLVQEGQGRVCQVAMILTDSQGIPLSEFCTLVKPDKTDWEIHPGAQAVHGKTKAMCMTHGIEQQEMVDIFDSFMSRASQIVAHNESFDRGMMEVELAYAGAEDPLLREWFCTMKKNTHISRGRWPKLDYALQHFCGRSMGNSAHDAMADTRACRDIFFAMRGIQIAA